MIYNDLYDYQKKIIDKFKDRQAFGLWLDMGLGKTPLALSFAEQFKADKIIVITLKTKTLEKSTDKGSWLFWADKMDDKYNYLNAKSEDFNKTDKELLLINYEALYERNEDHTMLKRNITQFLSNAKNKKVVLICDEAHKLKNGQSKQTKAVSAIWHYLKTFCNAKLYLLTGTPFTQGYIDLYTQLKLLGMKENKAWFEDMFCVRGNVYGLLGWQQPIVGYKNVDKLFDLIHQYAITIKTNEVLDLPEQVFIEHSYKQTEIMKLFTTEKLKSTELHKINNSFENSTKKVNNPYFRNIAYPEFTWVADTSTNFWLRSRELSIGFQGNSETYKFYDETRFKLLRDFLKDNQDNYILFYSYTPEFIELFNMISKLDYNIDVYNGTIKQLKYYDAWSKLSDTEKTFNKHNNIILTNWMSGSTGINFQEYNHCIIFDLPVYRDWEQGIKRIHRIGQKETCFYHLFYQDNFLDKSMYKSIQEKREYTKDTFESDLKRVQEIMK